MVDPADSDTKRDTLDFEFDFFHLWMIIPRLFTPIFAEGT